LSSLAGGEQEVLDLPVEAGGVETTHQKFEELLVHVPPIAMVQLSFR
jgi:hypothetical protein